MGTARSPRLSILAVRVTVGCLYWVDADAGFPADDQRALVGYLLAYRP